MMILEMYTIGLDDIKKNGELTSNLLTQAYRKNWENFKSRAEYRSYNEKINYYKIKRALPIIEFCKEKNISNILSIGSGGAVTEIEIKDKIPYIEMFCTDYVNYICDKLSELHKDMVFKVFDMKSDDPHILGTDFEMVLFCGSDYVMSNNEYVKLLKSLNNMGVKYIYIVNSPYININDKVKQIAMNTLRTIGILTNYTSSKDSKVSNALRGFRKGLFHGYSRDFKELKMIFKEAGYKTIRKNFGGVTKLRFFPLLTATNVTIILELNQENHSKEQIK